MSPGDSVASSAMTERPASLRWSSERGALYTLMLLDLYTLMLLDLYTLMLLHVGI